MSTNDVKVAPAASPEAENQFDTRAPARAPNSSCLLVDEEDAKNVIKLLEAQRVSATLPNNAERVAVLEKALNDVGVRTDQEAMRKHNKLLADMRALFSAFEASGVRLA